MESLKLTKAKLGERLALGRRWNRLCGEYKGLLCFLLFSKQYGDAIDRLKLVETEVSELHALLDVDYMMLICRAGKALEDSLMGADVEFAWEALPSFDITRLSKHALLSRFQLRQPIMENLSRPEEYPLWDRPDGWPEDWPWPADPTMKGASGCEICGKTSCDCINRPSRFLPRIKRYGEKGYGLQAVGETHGTIVGWLFGKIAPIEEAAKSSKKRAKSGKIAVNDWTLEFVRPDLPDQPAVCHLDCRDSSNYFRLLNHGRYVCCSYSCRKSTTAERSP